jgi:hypothetical protein
MEKLLQEAKNENTIIGNAFNFWRDSSKNGFDSTRQNNHETCSSINFETTTTPIQINPARSALAIIDMQNFFCIQLYDQMTRVSLHQSNCSNMRFLQSAKLVFKSFGSIGV